MGIQWAYHAEQVRKEIALQQRTEALKRVPPNPERMARLEKDLRHCENMQKKVRRRA